MCNSPVSQLPTPITRAGSILTITVGIPPAKVLAEDLTKVTLREGSPNIGDPKVHEQENYQQINSFP